MNRNAIAFALLVAISLVAFLLVIIVRDGQSQQLRSKLESESAQPKRTSEPIAIAIVAKNEEAHSKKNIMIDSQQQQEQQQEQTYFVQTLKSIRDEKMLKLDDALKKLNFNRAEKRSTQPQLIRGGSAGNSTERNPFFGAIIFPVSDSINIKRRDTISEYQKIINDISGQVDFDCVIQARVIERTSKSSQQSKYDENEIYYKSCSEFLFHHSAENDNDGDSSFHLLTFDVSNIAEYVLSLKSNIHEDDSTTLEVRVFLRKWMDFFDAVDDSIESITRIVKKKHSSFDFPPFEVSLPQNHVREKQKKNTPMSIPEKKKLNSDQDSYFWIANSAAHVASSSSYKPPAGIGYTPWQNMDLTLVVFDRHDNDNDDDDVENAVQIKTSIPKTPNAKMDFWLKDFPSLVSRVKAKGEGKNDMSKKSTTTMNKFNTVFIGDSQPRTLYRHLQAVINKRDAVIHTKDFDIFAENDFAASRYVWDAYLTRFSNSTSLNDQQNKSSLLLTLDSKKHQFITSEQQEEENALPDVVFFSIGPWPASFGQWSFKRYFDQMIEVKHAIDVIPSNQFNSNNKKKIRFVNLGPFSWPKPRLTTGFRISNARLRLFSELNKKVFLADDSSSSMQNKIHHVNVWHWTHCVAKKYHRGDSMHFSSAVLFEVLRNLMLKMDQLLEGA